MQFALYCLDRPEGQALRAEVRPAHLDYLRSIGAAVLLAGPLLSEDGSRSIGSLVVLDAPDRAAAEALSENDPYARAGLFAEVRLIPFRRVLPE